MLSGDKRFDSTCSKYADFVQRKSTENATFAFWSSYIDMMQLLLLFVRATREVKMATSPGHSPINAMVFCLRSSQLCSIFTCVLAGNGEFNPHTSLLPQ